MHFLTALAISMLSFSTTIVAIDYPNIADLVSKERVRGTERRGVRSGSSNSQCNWAGLGQHRKPLGGMSPSLYQSSLVKMFNSGFVRMINHDASAFARAVHCSFLPQQAVTGCKCPLDGWCSVCIILLRLIELTVLYDPRSPNRLPALGMDLSSLASTSQEASLFTVTQTALLSFLREFPA